MSRLHDAQSVFKNTENSVALFLGTYTVIVSTVPSVGVIVFGLYSNDCGFEIAEQQMASRAILQFKGSVSRTLCIAGLNSLKGCSNVDLFV